VFFILNEALSTIPPEDQPEISNAKYEKLLLQQEGLMKDLEEKQKLLHKLEETKKDTEAQVRNCH
jgi:hypothetical protein